MFSRICCQSTRTISLFRAVRAKNYYDSLEISPHATQAEIKESYYKLSMIYHPDRNTSSEAANKFRDLSEAYEVLRNVRLRKLYDKGLFLHTSTSVVDEDVNKFYKSRQHRSKPPSTGRTPIYDFDEWSKSHYGATLAKDIFRKKRRQEEAETKISDIEDIKKERIILAGLCLFLMGCFLFYETEDFDKVAEEFSMPKR